MNNEFFYERNEEFISSSINKCFEEILWMEKNEFRNWVIELRKLVVHLWDYKNLPPRVGYNKNEIVHQFSQLESFPVNSFLCTDELTNEKNVVRNTSVLGNAVNQWFPTMMKTRINYTKDVNSGKSIYDYFANADLLETFITYASRHFKRDSFYHYSFPVKEMDTDNYEELPVCSTGKEWIEKFEDKYRQRNEYDYWLSPKNIEKEYSGYNEELKSKKFLIISKEEIEKLQIPQKCKTNVDYDKSENYQIRVFKYGQKLFPVGLKAFRVSFCQYAVNFPPLTAKWVYDTFTEKFKDDDTVIIWDPSSGWGGRLLGALSVKDDRHIKYLGNDPNTDHNTYNNRTKYHEIYDFYIKNIKKGGIFGLDHNDFEFWQCGSEVIQYNQKFKQYKGKISLVFTSPPYFAKEAYSQDDEQSYKKFSMYDEWKEGFLRETLKTAYEWLRPGGYIIWNIADAVFGGEMLPLEKDSCEIMEELGFKFVKKYKMSLAQMPGGNRIDEETGLPKAKNFCKVKGMWLKYEPLFVYIK